MHEHKFHGHARNWVQLCSSQETWSGSSTLTTSSVALTASSFYCAHYFTRWYFQTVTIPKLELKLQVYLEWTWREDAFLHWKFCKFLTYERTYLPVFCFLCVLHVPFLRGKTSNEKQNRDEWTFLYEHFLVMQRNRTVKRVTSRKVYIHFINMGPVTCVHFQRGEIVNV